MSSTLVLGGVRSGKSRYAQRLARESGLPVTCIVTATAGGDEEMRARIARHRAERPAHWRTREEPLQLAPALAAEAAAQRLVLVDCLTLWLTNLLLSGAPPEPAIEALLEQVPSLPGELVLVSNEVGLGLIGDTALARRFCDCQGELHQRLAAVCDRVVFMVAGLPQTLRGPQP